MSEFVVYGYESGYDEPTYTVWHQPTQREIVRCHDFGIAMRIAEALENQHDADS